MERQDGRATGRGGLGRQLLWAPTSDGRIWVPGVTLEQSGLTFPGGGVQQEEIWDLPSRAAALSILIILGNKDSAKTPRPGTIQNMSPTPQKKKKDDESWRNNTRFWWKVGLIYHNELHVLVDFCSAGLVMIMLRRAEMFVMKCLVKIPHSTKLLLIWI